MKINRLDHLVLTVKDVQITCEFYHRVLGMEIITFGNDRKALLFGRQKINLHESGHEIDPKAFRPTEGAADLCFIADTEIEEVLKELEQHADVNIIESLVERTGATGKITSIYFRDPDQNLIEVSNYK